MKKISVIIPTFNRSDYIGQAVSSVLDQNNLAYEIEVIVVDNGSTDNTESVLKKFGDKIIYLKIPEAGRPSIPRNVGINHATGDLIAFQDSDDIWAPDKLVTQLKIFEDPEAILSFGNAEVIDTEGKKLNKLVVDRKALTRTIDFKGLLATNAISTLTVIVRRNALDEVGLFNEDEKLRVGEDYDLWLRLAARFPKGLRPIDRSLAFYRQHSSNVSHDSGVGSLKNILVVLNSLWRVDYLSQEQRQQLEHRLFEIEENYSRLANETEPSSRPTISVVMSVYNGQAYLQRAVDSILRQTYKDFEFIIIEDGSTEPVLQQLRDIKDPRVRIIPQTNHGLVYSLNQGVKLARGTFIARQDSDDISVPERFSKELDLIKTDERLAVVGSFFTYVDLEDKPSITIVMPTLPEDLHLSLFYTNPIGHGTALIRKQALVEAGLYNDNYHAVEDYNLWRQLAPHWRFAIVPESLYLYRINPDSISHSKQSTQHDSRDKIVSELWSGPIPFLSPLTIRKHYKTYRQLPKYAADVLDVYKNMLHNVAFESVRRKKWRTFVSTWSGLVLVAPPRALRVLVDIVSRLPRWILAKLKGHKS